MFDRIMKTPESFCCDQNDYKLLECFSSMAVTSEGELIVNACFFRFIVIIILFPNVNSINSINSINFHSSING